MPDLERQARELTESMQAVANGLREVRQWRRRFTLTAAAAGVLVCVALGLGGWAIAAVNAAQHATCEASNQGRAGNVALWDHVLSLPPSSGKPRTPAQQVVVREFRTFVHRVYKQRNCG
jgi:hypothetical protein